MDKKILIVDDEQGILTMLTRAFEMANYEVFTAISGADAIDILDGKQIKMMLFDLQMPDMNGVELCQAIRATNPIAYIIAMTGFTSLFELSECRDIGFDDYFTKPLNIKTLIATIDDAYDRVDRWTAK